MAISMALVGILLATIAAASACRAFGGEKSGACGRLHIGVRQYRVEARYVEGIDFGGTHGPVLHDVRFDVTYQQVARRSGSPDGCQVDVTPLSGGSCWGDSQGGESPATERPGVDLAFTGDGVLLRVGNFGPSQRGSGAGLAPLNFAPLYPVLVGTRPVPSEVRSWNYDDKLLLADLGEFSVEVSGRSIGIEQVGGRGCWVADATLVLPAGRIYAALVRAADPQITGEGSEQVQSRVSLDASTGELVSAAGTFSGEAVLHVPSLARTQCVSGKGAFSVELM